MDLFALALTILLIVVAAALALTVLGLLIWGLVTIVGVTIFERRTERNFRSTFGHKRF